MINQADLPPPPYPSATRAKGWRFELDYEKIEQSDTWTLAAEVPLARPCLLMMWLAAWTQEPCGSLPSDEAVIRARCQIPPSTWLKVKDVLMRGWWTASDGRLYHPTLTKRVEEMIEYRRKTAERVATFKAAKREQQEGNALLTREQQEGNALAPIKNDTGTGTGTLKEIPPIPPKGEKTTAVGLKSWIESVKAKGEKSIPEGDPVFEYADEIGLPHEFLVLAWREFRHHYTQPGAKRYRDWRIVFRKAVRGNWLKLWWLDGEAYSLTTRGLQAQRVPERAA